MQFNFFRIPLTRIGPQTLGEANGYPEKRSRNRRSPRMDFGGLAFDDDLFDDDFFQDDNFLDMGSNFHNKMMQRHQKMHNRLQQHMGHHHKHHMLNEQQSNNRVQVPRVKAGPNGNTVMLKNVKDVSNLFVVYCRSLFQTRFIKHTRFFHQIRLVIMDQSLLVIQIRRHSTWFLILVLRIYGFHQLIVGMNHAVNIIIQKKVAFTAMLTGNYCVFLSVFTVKHNQYNSSASATYKRDNRKFSIKYGTGSVDGFTSKDTIFVNFY